jgi:hypothetical protein
MICPKCSAINNDAAYTCASCGRVLRSRVVTRDESKLAEDPKMRMLMPVGRSGWAIAAGYAGLFGFLIAPAPIALVLGIIAMFDLKRNPKKYGWGRAIFGTIIGLLGTGLLIAVFLVP